MPKVRRIADDSGPRLGYGKGVVVAYAKVLVLLSE